MIRLSPLYDPETESVIILLESYSFFRDRLPLFWRAEVGGWRLVKSKGSVARCKLLVVREEQEAQKSSASLRPDEKASS